MKNSFRNSLMIVLTLLALTFSALGVTPAYAATTITVTNNLDSGPGSLRNAIANAVSGDTITFDNDYTITLANQLEIIDKTVTISGVGHAITISGNNAVRVFHVGQSGGSGNLTLDHLNIVNGKSTVNECAGSAVACGGGLMLEYLTTATVSNSTFSNNDGGLAGGAIYSYYGNPLTVTNSTFINNHAIAYGGAIEFFYGSATLTNNTFIGNTAGAYGSAILNTWGTVTLRNNIIVKGATSVNACDNDFSDGGSTNDGGGNIRFGDATCVGTAGDYGGNVPTLPLLPGSPAINAASANCPATDARGVTRGANCDSGAFESLGFTLTKTDGDGQSVDVNAWFAVSLTVASAHGEPVDGGVVTFTAPSTGASANPTLGSVAISGGAALQKFTANNTAGSYNVTASASGAASVDFARTNLLCSTSITVTNNTDSDAGSLRQAIANVCADGNITFDNDYTITLASQLTIGKNMTIDGGSHAVTISGNHAVRVMDIEPVTATLNHLTVANGNASDWGGGIQNNNGGILTVLNSAFSGNTAPYSGAIFNGATLTIANSTFYGNTADNNGGAIGNKFGALTITNSTFNGNDAASGIGGISNYGGTATLYNTIVANNAGGNCSNGVDGGVSMAITNGGNNIDSGATCGWDSANGSMSNTNPMLGAFGNHGGPTQTTSLLFGSPAVGAGNDTICAAAPVNNLDQRGVTRPQGAHCDIGSYEADNYAPTNISLSNNKIAENKPAGSVVGTLSTTDPDAGDTFAYSLACATPGANDGSFTITGNSLKTKAAFDYEVKNSYAICIRTTDLGGLFFDKNFTVTVTDVNEETAKNGGFNLYPAGKKIPTSWVAALFATTDGKDTAVKKEGAASVKIAGATGKVKTLTQTLSLIGPLGDTFTFSYWVKANQFPAAGLCQAQVSFYSGNTLKGTKTLKCPTGATYNWKPVKLSFTAPAAYTKVVIKFTFSKASGTVWFDLVSLLR
jgi:hypothetical protein